MAENGNAREREKAIRRCGMRKKMWGCGREKGFAERRFAIGSRQPVADQDQRGRCAIKSCMVVEPS